MQRAVFAMRIQADQVPETGTTQRLDLPASVNAALDSEGWRIVSHDTATADLSGDMILTFYAERD